MEFHEDVIFKSEGQKYGQELIEIINIQGKIVKVHQTEYGIVDPKMFKPDLVFELEDKIVILEFQSTRVRVMDKRRFRFYSAIFDSVKIKSKKPIEVHVLSTVEASQMKCYRVNSKSRFPIFIHSLKDLNGDEFINRMKTKVKNSEEFNKKELLMISLLCFMDTETDISDSILSSAETITDITGPDNEMGQFVKGIILMLCDKFVKDELLNKKITNLVGGNMKNVEKYAERVAQEKVKETMREFIINLDKKGFSVEDIAETANADLDFVKKTLSK